MKAEEYTFHFHPLIRHVTFAGLNCEYITVNTHGQIYREFGPLRKYYNYELARLLTDLKRSGTAQHVL